MGSQGKTPASACRRCCRFLLPRSVPPHTRCRLPQLAACSVDDRCARASSDFAGPARTIIVTATVFRRMEISVLPQAGSSCLSRADPAARCGTYCTGSVSSALASASDCNRADCDCGLVALQHNFREAQTALAA